jgi:ubiquitin C-terminal hydrolase
MNLIESTKSNVRIHHKTVKNLKITKNLKLDAHIMKLLKMIKKLKLKKDVLLPLNMKSHHNTNANNLQLSCIKAIHSLIPLLPK